MNASECVWKQELIDAKLSGFEDPAKDAQCVESEGWWGPEEGFAVPQ